MEDICLKLIGFLILRKNKKISAFVQKIIFFFTFYRILSTLFFGTIVFGLACTGKSKKTQAWFIIPVSTNLSVFSQKPDPKNLQHA